MAAGFITLIRRTFVAVIVGMAVAAAIRVRGRGGVPPQTGGWRELRDDELEAERIGSNAPHTGEAPGPERPVSAANKSGDRARAARERSEQERERQGP